MAIGGIRRGDVVLARMPGDKARPSVVVRSNLLAELPYVTILPITSHVRALSKLRLDVAMGESTGLRLPSQVMVDWPQTIRVAQIGGVIGALDATTMEAITRTLAVVLGIGTAPSRPGAKEV